MSMKDFKSIIGGNPDEVKLTRVNNATASIKDESLMQIQKLKMEYRNYQNTIEDALDLGVENTNDVATNLKNIVPSELLNKIYNTADNMSVVARRIKIRVKIHNTLFPKDTVEDLTEYELDFLNGIV